MSNKTQLQANNTKLAALIETLNGKAAGGGSTQTVTVDYKAPSGTNRMLIYQDKNGSQTYTGNNTTLECVAPSFAIVRSDAQHASVNSFQPVATLRTSSPYIYVFYITDNCTINFSSASSGGGIL